MNSGRYAIRELNMSLKDEIEEIKKVSGNNSAATTFLSMYMWRNVYGTNIVCQDGFYALKVAGEENTWFFPTGAAEAKRAFIEYGLNNNNFKLLFATREDVEFIQTYFTGKMDATESPEDSEYLYSTDEYRTMEGSQFRKIRYEFKQVEQKDNIDCIEITRDNIHMIDDIIADWADDTDFKGVFSTKRDGFDRSVFDDLEGNGIKGIIITQDNKPLASIAGIIVDNKIYSVFFGEHKKNEDGLIGYCMHRVVPYLDKDVEYINMEEDLGIEGLKTWKNKMRPVKLIDMWECCQI